ncbi:hypothetical protein [Terribacillus saccharophilus]|uniref:Uncharacterized protein n=1 Tax=Terribacillus saccharophilus TaxID=361277 RepID=A0A268AAW1_9BACI|nr:hypothetical protein [Terribacillus saccharophilus]PAD21255.1 hypothetical protein CHH64_10010 [Terribacillus saccharophilus]PAF17046.1 hypothetical protein CHH51_14240 [Terribacillus saccharophilus]PAF21109.1 hypothetical protein CHH49_13795 [Terribacillus saccharophilus]PAF36054.1 hypothetical protein CHH58_13960 [Terribacillus saccharophilus]PAF39790.1 hypothetical protein CHH69_06365 [Terribacillus saccharophilus]
MPTYDEWQVTYKETAIREIHKYFRIYQIGNITEGVLEAGSTRIAQQAERIDDDTFASLLEQISRSLAANEIQDVRNKYYELEQLPI